MAACGCVGEPCLLVYSSSGPCGSKKLSHPPSSPGKAGSLALGSTTRR
jgi:hypothetical protein